MDAFTTHTGTAAPLRRSNVDTDQIIPAEYLKRITRSGFEDGLFKAWRTNEPDFILAGSDRESNVPVLLRGTYQSPILVQWQPAEKQERHIDIVVVQFS